jgi:NAD(P)-dependent dehydrogenase (short-subunit alcohol dehydrogenase family)
MKSLQNKVAIITGAGSGIGKATAILFAQEGAKVIVSDINKEHGLAVADEIKSKKGIAVFLYADVSSPDHNENLVNHAISEFGALHIAVNNAGIGGPLAMTAEYPLEGWQKVIDTNLSGVFYGMKYQIPAIIKSGGGSIVNNSSILGQVGTRLSPAYVTSKHGMIGLTRAAALEYANQNLRINSVGPGYIKTPLVMNTLDEATRNYVVGLHPMGRMGESEEVAEIFLWLASDKSSFVTGSYYAIDGGYLAQ